MAARAAAAGDVALDELAQRLESTYLTDESIAQVHKPSLRVVKFHPPRRLSGAARARRRRVLPSYPRRARGARRDRGARRSRAASTRANAARDDLARALATAEGHAALAKGDAALAKGDADLYDPIFPRDERHDRPLHDARMKLAQSCAKAVREEEAREEEARGGGADGMRAAPFVEDTRAVWELETGVLREQVIGGPGAPPLGGPLAQYALRLLGAWTPRRAWRPGNAVSAGGAAGAAVARPLGSSSTAARRDGDVRRALCSRTLRRRGGDGGDDGDKARAEWVRPLVRALEQIKSVADGGDTQRVGGARVAPVVPWGATRMVLVALRVVACRRDDAASATSPLWWRALDIDDGGAKQPSRLVAALVALLARAERDAKAEAKAEVKGRGGRGERDAKAAAADDDDNEQGEGAERVHREECAFAAARLLALTFDSAACADSPAIALTSPESTLVAWVRRRSASWRGGGADGGNPDDTTDDGDVAERATGGGARVPLDVAALRALAAACRARRANALDAPVFNAAGINAGAASAVAVLAAPDAPERVEQCARLAPALRPRVVALARASREAARTRDEARWVPAARAAQTFHGVALGCGAARDALCDISALTAHPEDKPPLDDGSDAFAEMAAPALGGRRGRRQRGG